MNIAETPQLWKHPYYETIKTLIAELNQQNLIKNGAGFCYAISDLIHHRLDQLGIKSTIIECEMTLVCSDPPAFVTVGHKEGVNLTTSDSLTPGKIFTHVIVLVEHEQPLLIDGSVSHLLPDPFTWVCGLADNHNPIAELTRGNWHLTYRQKTGDQFPAIHQKSIVDRMLLDQKIDNVLKQLVLAKKLAAGVMVLILIVFAYDFYITERTIDRQIINSGRISILEKQQEDTIERLRSYRDSLLDLQNTLIKRNQK